mmetsp:Transcript_14697/g.29491  ORF Transcript_14697/g.29491 Transcript_14697/m.29491 type:complete len:361 (+) Transcript_14697:2030-3112(+)
MLAKMWSTLQAVGAKLLEQNREKKAARGHKNAIEVGHGAGMLLPEEAERRINQGAIQVVKQLDAEGKPMLNAHRQALYQLAFRSISLREAYDIVWVPAKSKTIGSQLNSGGAFRLVPSSGQANANCGDSFIAGGAASLGASPKKSAIAALNESFRRKPLQDGASAPKTMPASVQPSQLDGSGAVLSNDQLILPSCAEDAGACGVILGHHERCAAVPIGGSVSAPNGHRMGDVIASTATSMAGSTVAAATLSSVAAQLAELTSLVQSEVAARQAAEATLTKAMQQQQQQHAEAMADLTSQVQMLGRLAVLGGSDQSGHRFRPESSAPSFAPSTQIIGASPAAAAHSHGVIRAAAEEAKLAA